MLPHNTKLHLVIHSLSLIILSITTVLAVRGATTSSSNREELIRRANAVSSIGNLKERIDTLEKEIKDLWKLNTPSQ